MNLNPSTNGTLNVQKTDQGNQLSILLLILPFAALLYSWNQNEYFNMPVNVQDFLLYSLTFSSITCLFLFAASFWNSRKTPTLVIIFIVCELLWGFAGIALLPVLNVKYDRSEEVFFEKKVLEVYRWTSRSSFIRVESWNGRNEYLYPPVYMYDSIKPNSTVIRFSTRSGRLGHEYVNSLEGSKYKPYTFVSPLSKQGKKVSRQN